MEPRRSKSNFRRKKNKKVAPVGPAGVCSSELGHEKLNYFFFNFL